MAVSPYRFIKQFADGSYFVPCGITFLDELADAVAQGLIQVTNLGQYGDSNHASSSRHSPHRANGKLWIAGFDLGGRDYPMVAEFWRAMWNAGDPRVRPNGFAQRGDGRGLNWDNGQWKWTGKDQGHMHGDFAMAHPYIGGREDTGWWVDALSSTAPWHFIHWLRTGEAIPLGAADPIENEHINTLEDDMAAVPQSEWAEVRKAVLKDADDSAAARSIAAEARRLCEVILRRRPAMPGELVPALPAGTVDVTFRFGLNPGERLAVGERLFSPDGRTHLVLQGDGNLGKYDYTGRVLWSSKTKTATSLVMQGDGNLVLYDAKGNAVWHTGTFGKPGASLSLQSDQNLVVRADGNAVWASGK